MCSHSVVSLITPSKTKLGSSVIIKQRTFAQLVLGICCNCLFRSVGSLSLSLRLFYLQAPVVQRCIALSIE